MSAPVFDPEALIDPAASLLGLAIAPAHRPGVAANLALLARHAAIALSVALPPEAEPAPLFRPDMETGA